MGEEEEDGEVVGKERDGSHDNREERARRRGPLVGLKKKTKFLHSSDLLNRTWSRVFKPY